MSVLKRVPDDIKELRLFIQKQAKYYYLAVDEYVSVEEDEQGVEHEVEVPRKLLIFGYFSKVWVLPTNGKPMYIFMKNREGGLGVENSRRLLDEKIKQQGFAERLVYTDYPPAAGSVPLNYDDYIESMRMNDLDGGGKKTRKRKNIKSKKTQKYKKRRCKR